MLKLKEKITGQTGNDGTKDVYIIVPWKYLSNFWRTIEIPWVNCEINLILTLSTFFFTVANQKMKNQYLEIKNKHFE